MLQYASGAAGRRVDVVDARNVEHVTHEERIPIGDRQRQSAAALTSRGSLDSARPSASGMSIERHGFIPATEASAGTQGTLFEHARNGAGWIEYRRQRVGNRYLHTRRDMHRFFTCRAGIFHHAGPGRVVGRHGCGIGAESANDVVGVLVSPLRSPRFNLLRDLLNSAIQVLILDLRHGASGLQSLLHRINLEVHTKDLIAGHCGVDVVERLRRIAQAVADQEALRKANANSLTDRKGLGVFLVLIRVENSRNREFVD